MKTLQKIAFPTFLFALAGLEPVFAGTALLDNVGGLKPSIAITESLTDTVAKRAQLITLTEETGDEYTDVNENGRYDVGEPYVDRASNPGNRRGVYDAPGSVRKTFTYAKDPVQRVTAKIVANLPSDFDFDTIDEDTEVELVVGNYKFTGKKLGDEESRGVDAEGDPNPLGTSAIFKFGPRGEDDVLLKHTGSLKIEWSAVTKTVTFTLAHRTRSRVAGIPVPSDEDDQVSVLASKIASLSATNAPLTAVRSQPIPVSVKFGAETGKRIAYGRGQVKARSTKVFTEPTDRILKSVNLVAGADVTGPTVTLTVPAAADIELGGVDFLAMLADRRVEPTFSNEVIEFEEDDIAGFDDIPTLGVLINGLGAFDEDGNPTAQPIAVDPTTSSGGALGVDEDGNFINAYVNGVGYFGGFAALYDAANTITFIASDRDGNTTRVTKAVTGVPIGVFEVATAEE